MSFGTGLFNSVKILEIFAKVAFVAVVERDFYTCNQQVFSKLRFDRNKC